ncbi:hypothetical protein RB195_024133 [Necator americanus]|uniref:Uncharacterized protein n=1 Tax=Necator americanus TaxID=51031 RepID=A0ABR1EM62_NECAM
MAHAQKAGFDYENIDSTLRMAAHQEQVNKRVLSEYIRIVGVPNIEKMGIRELVKKFLNEIKDTQPLTWPTSTGNNIGTSSFRVKMSDSFWQYFLNEGRKRLMEFNRRERSNVRVLRDQTIPITDLENLSLYMRKKIRLYYQSKKGIPPEMSVKNGFITITSSNGEKKRMRATELAIVLGWEYNDWQGICIRKLMTNTEKKNLADGKLTWGSMSIEEFKAIECYDKVAEDTEKELSASTEVANTDKVRKRALAKTVEEDENLPPKPKQKIYIEE